jgi:hypothetical protein
MFAARHSAARNLMTNHPVIRLKPVAQILKPNLNSEIVSLVAPPAGEIKDRRAKPAHMFLPQTAADGGPAVRSI